MAASVTRGTSFTDGQKDITVAQFNPLLTAATIAGVDRDNLSGAISAANYDSDALSNPTFQEVWQDDITNLVKTYDGISDYVPGIEPAITFTLSPTAPESITPGMVLMPSQDIADAGTERVQACTKTLRFAAVGVSADTVAPGGTGRLIRRGPARVKIATSITAGNGVSVSSTNGSIEDLVGGGLGAGVLGVALEADSGGFAWVSLRA